MSGFSIGGDRAIPWAFMRRGAHGLYDVPHAEWITVPVPRLVDPALFDAVSEQLAENRARNRQAARGTRYLLQGLLVCGVCGYAYYGKAISLRAAKGNVRDYAYYNLVRLPKLLQPTGEVCLHGAK